MKRFDSIWIISGDAENEAAGPLPALRSFANYSGSNGYHVVVFSTIDRKSVSASSAYESSTKWIKCKRIGPFNLHFAPSMLLEAYSVWRENRPAVVVLDGVWYTVGALLATMLAVLRVPVFIIPHGSFNHHAFKRRTLRKKLLFKCMKPLFNRARGFLALSPFESDEVRSLFPLGCIHATSNAVATTGGWHGADGSFIFLGRIDPIKNIEFIIDAYAIARNQGCNVKLKIYGPGQEDYVESLRARCQNLGVQEGVLFCGAIYGQEKMDAFRASRGFLMASHSEGQPYALLEALSVGLPAIITDRCQLWLHDPSVTCVEHNNLQQYSEQLIRMSSLSRDEIIGLSVSAVALIQNHYRGDIVWSHRLKLFGF